jgi:Pyruvate/2-oxoacid:ferredoxin oxidoreductase delta subunit
MTTTTIRKMVTIDEEKCTGCGNCIISCAEGALEISDGKAKLISDRYCDGLGNCLDCPEGAITLEEREAETYDEAAVEEHLKDKETVTEGFTCPSEQVTQFTSPAELAAAPAPAPAPPTHSRLGHWPVQLTLVPPAAPFLKNADVVLAADCVPFAYAGFHGDFLAEDKALLVACPKLDDFPAHQEKLTQILKQSGLKSLTVLHMEVPCCSGLVYLAKQAMLASGNVVPFSEVTIGVQGNVKS